MTDSEILKEIKAKQVQKDLRDAQIFRAVQQLRAQLVSESPETVTRFLQLNDIKREACVLPPPGGRWSPTKMMQQYLVCANKAELYRERALRQYEVAAEILRAVRAFLELQLDDPRTLIYMLAQGAFRNALSRKEIELLFRAENASCDLELIQERWLADKIPPTVHELRRCQEYWGEQKQLLDHMFGFEFFFWREFNKLMVELIPEWHRQALEADLPEQVADKWVFWKTRHWLKTRFFPHERMGSFPDVPLQALAARAQAQRQLLPPIQESKTPSSHKVIQEKPTKDQPKPKVNLATETGDVKQLSSRSDQWISNARELMKNTDKKYFVREGTNVLNYLADFYNENKNAPSPSAADVRLLQALSDSIDTTAALQPFLKQWKIEQAEALTEDATKIRERRTRREQAEARHRVTVEEADNTIRQKKKFVTRRLKELKQKQASEAPDVQKALRRAQKKEEKDLEALEKEETHWKNKLTKNYLGLLDGYNRMGYQSWTPEICSEITDILTRLRDLYEGNFPKYVTHELIAMNILSNYVASCQAN